MKTLVIALTLASCGLAFSQSRTVKQGQSKVVKAEEKPAPPAWIRIEGFDEITGPSVAYMLPAAETWIRSESQFTTETVHLTVVCKVGAGKPLIAFVETRIPLHIDDEGPRTFVLYRDADGKVISQRTKIGDNGTSIYNSIADAYKPFIGRVIEFEDIFGTYHKFHFPSVGLEPFEDGCK